MEGIVFIGLQASGKSTFYKEKFFDKYLRISMDMLNTRNKERQILDKCLELQQRVVIDNTNPTRIERAVYIEKFRMRKYNVIGYYFQSEVEECLIRNAQRTGKKRIPDTGIFATAKKMELPTLEEGFAKLYRVRSANRQFVIENW